jgi:hypothetical protein
MGQETTTKFELSGRFKYYPNPIHFCLYNMFSWQSIVDRHCVYLNSTYRCKLPITIYIENFTTILKERTTISVRKFDEILSELLDDLIHNRTILVKISEF